MVLKDWRKKREYLVCVDSDGAAMDTMDIKHIRCFGPCMVTEWGLETWRDDILKRWNDINLYTLTRGINRFKGLAMALEEIHEAYTAIEGIEDLKRWTEETKELSNRALEQAWKETGSACLGKALNWSIEVNKKIEALEDVDKMPFPGVKEGLRDSHVPADVAVVSSANQDAVQEEWERCGLLEHVDLLCCQNEGSKAHILEELLKKGYERDHVVMIGDALGDKAAAEQNGVLYYPILVKREEESWREWREKSLHDFINGTYAGYEAEKKQAFLDNLGG